MPITPAPAVVRACDVLHHLARHPTSSCSVSEVARDLQVPRATCDAVLQALAEGGFVRRRDDDLRYELGPACIVVGDAARVANSVLRSASGAARELAASLAACVAVSMREGDESRVVDVHDFGPPFGPRAQAGQWIPHAPPFGAVYVAWDEHDAATWIARAGGALAPAERERYRRALDAVRRRGYSVTIASPRRPELAQAIDALVVAPDAEHARRTRDELMAELVHHEYLATDLDGEAAVRVSHMSAPVFDRAGRAGASILVIGPEYEITTTELRARADALVRAAARATTDAGGRSPVAPALAPTPPGGPPGGTF
jgi:DNA-binding IclR family transcriptional regulator